MKIYIKSAIMNISDEDGETRMDIARTSSDPEVLSDLVAMDPRHTDTDVYRSIIIALSNPNLSLEDMYKYANASWDYKCELAKNPNLPDELLQKLAHDEDIDVQQNCLWNPNLPDADAERIVNSIKPDHLTWLANYGGNNPYMLIRIGTYSTDRRALSAVADNPATPIDTLYLLGTSDEQWVLQSLGTNPSTPIDLLEQLLQHHDQYIRAWAIGSPNITVEMLQPLLNDKSKYVRETAERRLYEIEHFGA
jgi:hypothetical protein